MQQFASTIGVQDNEKYPKFKEKEKLVFNVSSSRYFIVRFVAKNLFNFKISYKEIDKPPEKGFPDGGDFPMPKAKAAEEDWDIFWTDNSV